MLVLSPTGELGNPGGPTLPGSQYLQQWQPRQEPDSLVRAEFPPSWLGSSLVPGPLACDEHLRRLDAKNDDVAPGLPSSRCLFGSQRQAL